MINKVRQWKIMNKKLYKLKIIYKICYYIKYIKLFLYLD